MAYKIKQAKKKPQEAKEDVVYDIKNPKTFTLRGVNFNEFAVVARTEAEFIKEKKSALKNTSFFGPVNDDNKEELLKEAYRIAQSMTGKKAPEEAKKTEPAKTK